jgi:hypothetical protein
MAKRGPKPKSKLEIPIETPNGKLRSNYVGYTEPLKDPALERFCQSYAHTNNFKIALQEHGGFRDSYSLRAPMKLGRQILAMPHVEERVAILRKELGKDKRNLYKTSDYKSDRESVLTYLKNIMASTYEAEDYKTSLMATESIGRLEGYYIDRQEITSPLSSISAKEMKAFIEGLEEVRKLYVTLGKLEPSTFDVEAKVHVSKD